MKDGSKSQILPARSRMAEIDRLPEGREWLYKPRESCKSLVESLGQKLERRSHVRMPLYLNPTTNESREFKMQLVQLATFKTLGSVMNALCIVWMGFVLQYDSTSDLETGSNGKTNFSKMTGMIRSSTMIPYPELTRSYNERSIASNNITGNRQASKQEFWRATKKKGANP